MMDSSCKNSKPISKFAVFLGALAGFMAAFSTARHRIPSGLFDNLTDAIMWGGVFWVVIFICKYSLQRFKFFSSDYGSIDIKSALIGTSVCMLVYLFLIFLISVF